MSKLMCGAAASLLLAMGAVAKEATIELAKPTKQQLAWQDMEIGAFIHYGLNVYTGQEHGDGHEPASKFNPTELDAEQWVLAAKALGAKYAVLTARHEGGFCLWPTKTTDYSIANSPYKNGKGDIVRGFVNACRKHGIKPGLYHTASHDARHTHLRTDPVKWDRTLDKLISKNFERMGEKGRQAYLDIQEQQMRELLSNYGPITYVWCDHWDAGTRFAKDSLYLKMRSEVYRRTTQVMRELQPDCIMMGPDTWVPGNETGHVVYPMWNAVNTYDGTIWARPAPTKGDKSVPNDYGLLETEVRTGHPLGKFWRPRECTTNKGFHHGGWFWHPGTTRPKKLKDHVNLYYRTVGLGANTIINLPPDNRGLVPEDVVVAAQAFNDEIKKRFANPIVETKQVETGDVIGIEWRKPTEINTVVLMENIINGQRIAKYTLEAYVDGKWQTLEPVGRKYQTIGHKKIDRVEPVVTNRIRFKCLEAVVKPVELR